MKRAFVYLSIAAITAALFFACRKKDKYPPEPEIEYKSFIRFGEDSAMLHINFTDGDGDIGIDENDNNPPFNPGSEFYNNIFIKYYYKNPSGNFVQLYNPFDSTYVNWDQRVPVITPEGKDKSLKGEMIFRLDDYHLWDTSFYEVWIYDRALHKSNVVRTDTIIF